MREEDIDVMHALDVKQKEMPFIVGAFKEPNRRVIAKCRACGFEIHGPLLRVATDTGHPCMKCGALGTFVIFDASSAGRNDGGHSPPITSDVIGPRQPTVKRETNPESPAEVCFGPSVPLHHPYPPVRYEWEEWDKWLLVNAHHVDLGPITRYISMTMSVIFVEERYGIVLMVLSVQDPRLRRTNAQVIILDKDKKHLRR